MSTFNENIGKTGGAGTQFESEQGAARTTTIGGEAQNVGARAAQAVQDTAQAARDTVRDTTRRYKQRARQVADRAREQIYRDQDHSEGRVAWMIENQTARLPSDLFLWTAGGCIALALGLKMSGRHHDALFVGQWAPTFLILGLYNKIVKVHGHDENDYVPADMSSYGSYEAPYGAGSYGGSEYGGGDYGYEDLR